MIFLTDQDEKTHYLTMGYIIETLDELNDSRFTTSRSTYVHSYVYVINSTRLKLTNERHTLTLTKMEREKIEDFLSIFTVPGVITSWKLLSTTDAGRDG